MATQARTRGPLPMTEDQFLDRIIDTAHTLGWRVWHQRPARTEHGWRTAGIGDKGLPDLVMARRGRVVLAELKVGTNKADLDQRAWLTAAGRSGFLWYPRDWPEIVKVLA